MVYVVYNKSFRDQETNELVYKIGYTINTPKERYKHEATKMPGEFETLFAYRFSNYKEVEGKIHYEFKEFRIKGEWFKLNKEELERIKARCIEMNGEPVSEEELTKINKTKAEIDNNNNITNDPDGAVLFFYKDQYIEPVRAVIEAVKQFKINNPKIKIFNFGVLNYSKDPENNKVIYFHIENKGIKQKYWNAAYEQRGGNYKAECTLEVREGPNKRTFKEINKFVSSEIEEKIKEAIYEATGIPSPPSIAGVD